MDDKSPPFTHDRPPAKKPYLLPPEILSLIIQHLTPQDILSLSLTNHYHNAFTSTEAWRIYLQTHLPTAHTQILQEYHYQQQQQQHGPQYQGSKANWARWAEEATRVSRNFSRAGFVATALRPAIHMYVPRGPRRGPGGGQVNAWLWEPGTRGASGGRRQTVAYRPMVDSYSEFRGDRDVLAIGAGQDIMVSKGWGQRGAFWWGFENREERGGRDDVTGLHLLRPYEKAGNKDVEVALVGRANGRLEMLELDTRGGVGGTCRSKVVVRYHTDGRKVKGMDMMHEGNGGGVLMGAILNNPSLSIYNVRQPVGAGEPVRTANQASEVQFIDEQPWEVSFLDHTKVAVGKASTKPIAIHAITPSGLTQEPIREFSAKDCADMRSASVYVIKPLPRGSAGASANGDVFLSGCWDGIARQLPSPFSSLHRHFLTCTQAPRPPHPSTRNLPFLRSHRLPNTHLLSPSALQPHLCNRRKPIRPAKVLRYSLPLLLPLRLLAKKLGNIHPIPHRRRPGKPRALPRTWRWREDSVCWFARKGLGVGFLGKGRGEKGWCSRGVEYVFASRTNDLFHAG
ncbi:unnamed protein product [Tuber melanosporum]|uniref:(Perigord truffle) hypothetical protein n=1 Tax=Tuber melanosporum (strain Mel28) TaxID=656061 RepID=D5GL02_TUBMM|nr:uncharacterized protein GSTUM_00009857001 [Tuber melanosporum]CAZ85195.1 unnamed protein product [Tuber melanosporum]